MFGRCTRFNGNIGNWQTSKVTSFHQMFYDASQFEGAGMQSWSVGSSTIFKAMFYGATSFNADISSWDVSQASDLSLMFYRASSFEQNLWSWGDILRGGSVYFDDMFEKTGCPIWSTPDPANPAGGPWCLLSRDDVATAPTF